MIEYQEPSGEEIAGRTVPCDGEYMKDAQDLGGAEDEQSDKTDMVPVNTWAAHLAQLRSAWPE